MEVRSHAAAEGDPHAVNEREEGPSEGAASGKRDDVAFVNAELIEGALYAATAFDPDDAGTLPNRKLR